MRYKNKNIIVVFLLLSTILLSHNISETKYIGTKFISELKVPLKFSRWNGKDITKKLNINYEESAFNFINDALGYQYINNEGNSLIFIILDAGNLHDPKNCFISAGYKIKDLEDTEFRLPNRSLKAHTLFTQIGSESFISFYWIIIDKNIADEWIEQKLKQLYFSFFNAKRVGLMVRIDVPAKKNNVDDATIMTKQFINNLNLALSPEKAEYIFGISPD